MHVDGMVWPLSAFWIFSDTTLATFSFTADEQKHTVIKNETIKPINGRAIYGSNQLMRQVLNKKKTVI